MAEEQWPSLISHSSIAHWGLSWAVLLLISLAGATITCRLGWAGKARGLSHGSCLVALFSRSSAGADSSSLLVSYPTSSHCLSYSAATGLQEEVLLVTKALTVQTWKLGKVTSTIFPWPKEVQMPAPIQGDGNRSHLYMRRVAKNTTTFNHSQFIPWSQIIYVPPCKTYFPTSQELQKSYSIRLRLRVQDFVI